MVRPCGVVALLSDFGTQDAYAGVVKGAILSANPAARLVDLTHEVPAQDIAEGARILEASHPYFPDGSVFVAVVDPGVGTERAILAVEAGRHFYLAPDNGLLSFLNRDVQRIVQVRESRYFRSPLSRTFHGRDIFAPVAGLLSGGTDLAHFGPAVNRMALMDSVRPRVTSKGVEGEVVSIDHFGNLITNIPEKLLPASGKLRITVGRKTLRALSRSYADAPRGELLALVGSTGHLEISVNQGSARDSTRIHKGDRVLVTRVGR